MADTQALDTLLEQATGARDSALDQHRRALSAADAARRQGEQLSDYRKEYVRRFGTQPGRAGSVAVVRRLGGNDADVHGEPGVSLGHARPCHGARLGHGRQQQPAERHRQLHDPAAGALGQRWTSLPRLRTATRSEITMASAWSWVT